MGVEEPEGKRNSHQDVYAKIFAEVSMQIIDDLILEVIFELHRKVKTGTLCLRCDTACDDIVNKPGYDIFGHSVTGYTPALPLLSMRQILTFLVQEG